jgi:EAL domain-containing protein (putative c-di-GMP-specific phosphodiesterase class I)
MLTSVAEGPGELSPEAPSAAGEAGRILVVEDDRGLLEAYSDVLLEHGFRIAAACDGHAAVRMLGSASFDAVLTDVYMPEAGGLELLRSVRERDVDLPVVLVTGNPSLETAVQAVEMGALHYLMKPVSGEELVRCVRDAVAKHRQAARRRRPGQGEANSPAELAALDAQLESAMGSLYMTYQPIIRTRDGSVFGWEALLRTREPALDGPLAFLTLAERLGRVHEVGRKVRALVARTAKRARGRVFFVNLHAEDLLDEELFDAGSSLAVLAADIVLEITERRPLDDVPDVKERVRRLRELGFRVAVDDLGAGYSGLSSMAALEPEFVKLDRSLLSGIEQDLNKRRLVSSIASLGREMGICVVAEGVETEAERRVAAELGCELMQGFFFRQPNELAQETFTLAANG